LLLVSELGDPFLATVWISWVDARNVAGRDESPTVKKIIDKGWY
jgi:hypothetical protein